MIPEAFITEWSEQAPWPNLNQIEQDLILSRLMVEIANDELLGPELRMRGGTCLNKIHLPAPTRYSEDLDYVRSTHSGIKQYVAAIRRIADEVGLEVSAVNRADQMVHVFLDAEPTTPPGRIRVKIETNIAETKPFRPPIERPYRVDSSWWKGEAKISTFVIEELMGTKLRALYQRSKGRDLFDLWRVLTAAKPKVDMIADAFHHYMGERAFNYHDFTGNLAAKLADEDFRNDLNELLVAPPIAYTIETGADLVIEQLGSRLANAPGIAEIENGHWRS